MNPLKSQLSTWALLLCLLIPFGSSAIIAPTALDSNSPEVTPQTLEEHLGRKLRFSEKVAFKLFHKKIKKAARKSARSKKQMDCAKMVLKSGEVVEVDIIALTASSVRYKLCDQVDGEERTIDKAKVFSIQNSSGQVLFNSEEKALQKTSTEEVSDIGYKKTHNMAIAALVLGILSLLISFSWLGLICGILGIVFGALAKKKIQENPQEFKGRKMANAGLVCGIIACALYALTISALIAIF